MSDFGFVGAAYEAASVTQETQACVNWYPEIDQAKAEGERGVIALYPTPGLLSRLELVSGEVRGFHVLPGGGICIMVSRSTVYSVNQAYVATEIGNLQTTVGIVGMTDNGVSVYITDGQHRYYYTWSTGSFALIADGPFVQGGATDTIDNYMIYNQPGSSQWGCTDAGDIVSGALNLGTMVGASGNLVSLVADHRQVLLLGETYSERHADVGTFPFPFAVIPGSSIQHGLLAKDSVSFLGEGVAFLARDGRGQCVVVVWGAAVTTPQRISTFAIENAIQGYAVKNDAIGYTYTQAGHEFYVLTFPSADVTWVYDLSTQLWHRRAWRDANGVLHRHRSNCCAVFGQDIIVGDFENGTVYALSQSTYTDNGDPLPCIRRCRHLTKDLNRQFFHDLQIQFQPGVGLTGNPTSTGANYLNLPGSAGDYASTPDSAALDITGSIDLLGYIAPDAWARIIVPQVIVSKYVQVGNQRSFLLQMNAASNLQFQKSTDGTAAGVSTATSTAIAGPSGGGGRWVRAGYDGANVTFYISDDAQDTVPASISWTQLGTPVAMTGAIFSSTAQLNIGSDLIITPANFDGKIYSFYVYSGEAITGTLAASFVANDADVGDSTFVSSATGETYTVQGNASIAGDYSPAVQGSDPECILRWSNDGGFTWQNDRILKIGRTGRYKHRAIKRRLGYARDRVYEITVTDPVYRVVVSANLNASAGSS